MYIDFTILLLTLLGSADQKQIGNISDPRFEIVRIFSVSLTTLPCQKLAPAESMVRHLRFIHTLPSCGYKVALQEAEGPYVLSRLPLSSGPCHSARSALVRSSQSSDRIVTLVLEFLTTALKRHAVIATAGSRSPPRTCKSFRRDLIVKTPAVSPAAAFVADPSRRHDVLLRPIHPHMLPSQQRQVKPLLGLPDPGPLRVLLHQQHALPLRWRAPPRECRQSLLPEASHLPDHRGAHVHRHTTDSELPVLLPLGL